MKKYIASFLFAVILYSCNTGTNALVTNGGTSATSATISKQTSSASAESIFIINDKFQTQNNKDFVLSSLSGKPTVVGMIFTNCGYACPRLTSDMKNIAEKLKDERDKVNFVLISFDSERDNPVQLKKFQKEMGLDEDWILLHGSEETVRTLSVLLNVQFEKDAEGNFSHSNLVIVLDKKGKLAFQKEGLDADHKETIGKIEALLDDCCKKKTQVAKAE
jgi:protein SCO1/2